MKKAFEIPHVSEDQRTPLVNSLLEIIQNILIVVAELQTENQLLKDEIKRLKGHTPRPEIKPDIPKSIIEGTRDNTQNNAQKEDDDTQNNGKQEEDDTQNNDEKPKKERKKRSTTWSKKRKNLTIHEEKLISVDSYISITPGVRGPHFEIA